MDDELVLKLLKSLEALGELREATRSLNQRFSQLEMRVDNLIRELIGRRLKQIDEQVGAPEPEKKSPPKRKRS
jgi:hypothetical protein